MPLRTAAGTTIGASLTVAVGLLEPLHYGGQTEPRDVSARSLMLSLPPHAPEIVLYPEHDFALTATESGGTAHYDFEGDLNELPPHLAEYLSSPERWSDPGAFVSSNPLVRPLRGPPARG